MKIESAVIPIETRGPAECIDLAVLFYRAAFREIAVLTLLFGLPACAATAWISSSSEWGLPAGILVFALVSQFLGGALVVGAGHRVFGDPFTVGRSLRLLGTAFTPFLGMLLAYNLLVVLGWCFMLLPGIGLAVAFGFLTETLLLEQLRGATAWRRATELARGIFFGLLGRATLILLFFGGVVLSLFILVDLASGLLFGAPILIGRLSQEWVALSPFYLLLRPGAATLLTALLWVVYPLARLAWFFCYLDARIRKEAWDLEIQFRIEARRLSAEVDGAALPGGDG